MIPHPPISLLRKVLQMKSRSILTLLPLVLTLAAAAQQQTITPPPIKMGLWRTTSISTLGGMQLPPDVAARLKAMGKSIGGPQTINTLSCITQQKWQQMFSRSQGSQNCTFSNVQQSSSAMSADITCTSRGRDNSTGHMDMTFDSDSKMHGKFHMNVTAESQPQPMTVDVGFQGTYQGSDCQGISPDSPKVIQ